MEQNSSYVTAFQIQLYNFYKKMVSGSDEKEWKSI